MIPATNSSGRFRLVGKVCTFVGILLLVAGALVFLLRPMGEGEGDARPIVLAQYAVWLFIAGGLACFIGAVFRYASNDSSKDKTVAKPEA
jgi:hypothetical protein